MNKLVFDGPSFTITAESEDHSRYNATIQVNQQCVICRGDNLLDFFKAIVLAFSNFHPSLNGVEVVGCVMKTIYNKGECWSSFSITLSRGQNFWNKQRVSKKMLRAGFSAVTEALEHALSLEQLSRAS